MEKTLELKKEHEEMKQILNEIEVCIEEDIDHIITRNLLEKFGKIWEAHEEKEEDFLEEKQIPVRKMLINQHRELKGHWKIINDFCSPGNEKKLKVALDTDGRMLFKKFRDHMDKEEQYFRY